MSASPEFHRPPPSPGLLLPSVPLPAIVVSPPLPSNNVKVNADGDRAEEDQCRTPTSEESRLPTVIDSSPPPAPRKTRCTAAPRKRRLSTKLIAVGAEEMEQLFGWQRSFGLDHK